MQGRARLEIRGEGTHIKHAVHGCDAGRVEAQRLVERARAVEHVGHGCDAGRVEAQWLVERVRFLTESQGQAYFFGVLAGRREGGGRGGGASGMQGRARLEIRGEGTLFGIHHY